MLRVTEDDKMPYKELGGYRSDLVGTWLGVFNPGVIIWPDSKTHLSPVYLPSKTQTQKPAPLLDSRRALELGTRSRAAQL